MKKGYLPTKRIGKYTLINLAQLKVERLESDINQTKLIAASVPSPFAESHRRTRAGQRYCFENQLQLLHPTSRALPHNLQAVPETYSKPAL